MSSTSHQAFISVPLLQCYMLSNASLTDFILAMVLFSLQMTLGDYLAVTFDVTCALWYPMSVFKYSGPPTYNRSAATVVITFNNDRATFSTRDWSTNVNRRIPGKPSRCARYLLALGIGFRAENPEIAIAAGRGIERYIVVGVAQVGDKLGRFILRNCLLQLVGFGWAKSAV